MPELDQILRCFPSISDWKDTYLDDSRQRLLGDAASFSVEIILGQSLDRVGIFSNAGEEPEMVSVMQLFLGGQGSAGAVLDRARDFFAREPQGVFHAILGSHTLTISRVGGGAHFRISPSTDA